MWRKLHAVVILAWALVGNLVRSWLGLRRPGGERWLKQLAEEDLTATPLEAWDYLAETSRCVGCGLCEAVAADGTRPWLALVGAARAPADAPLVLDAAQGLRQVADDVARICPAGVRPEAVARLIEENALKLEGR